MAKPTDIKKATMTRQEWAQIIASIDDAKRVLCRDAIKKLMQQIDD